MTRYIGHDNRTLAAQIESELKRQRKEKADAARNAKRMAMLTSLRVPCSTCGHIRECLHTGYSFLCETCLSET